MLAGLLTFSHSVGIIIFIGRMVQRLLAIIPEEVC